MFLSILIIGAVLRQTDRDVTMYTPCGVNSNGAKGWLKDQVPDRRRSAPDLPRLGASGSKASKGDERRSAPRVSRPRRGRLKPKGDAHRLYAIAHAELAIDLAQMQAHRGLGHLELAGNLGVGATVGDQLQHLGLALRHRRQRIIEPGADGTDPGLISPMTIREGMKRSLFKASVRAPTSLSASTWAGRITVPEAP